MNTQSKTYVLLLWCNGLSSFGHFSAYGLLAIYFINTVKVPIEKVSFILLFFAIVLRASRLIFAPLIEIFSVRSALFYSMISCAFGYALLIEAKAIPIIFFALLLIGIGYGTNGLIIRSIISFVKKNNTLSGYAALNMVTNLAAAVGPLCGTLFMTKYPHYGLCLFSASVFAITATIIGLFPIHSYSEMDNVFCFKGLFKLFFDKNFRFVFYITIFSWFLLAQFFSLLPLYLTKGLNSSFLLGSIYLLNSTIIVLFSLPLNRWITHRSISLFWQLFFSFLLFFIGFLMLILFQNRGGFYLSILAWSFAESVMTPALNFLIIKVTQPNLRFSGFAMNGIAMGIGEGIGNFTGVTIASYCLAAQQWNSAFCLLACLSLGFCFYCKKLI